MGFNFGELDTKTGNLQYPDQVAEYKKAMQDPNFASMIGTMVSRKGLNWAGGNPFKAEAAYNAGPGNVLKAERAGNPLPSQSYIKQMFPVQYGEKPR